MYIIMFHDLVVYFCPTGVSGLVYKAYVKKEETKDVVAIKTGKGES